MQNIALRSSLLLLALCCAVVSCTRGYEELDEASNLNPITFSSDISIVSLTRATLSDSSMSLTDFTIYGHTNEDGDSAVITNLDGATISNTDGAWSYTPTATLKSGIYGSFYAFAGATTAEIAALSPAMDLSTGTLSFDYTIPDTDSQYDLLYVAQTDSALSAINLSFDHALSAINFKVLGDLSDNITAISISNIYDTATCVVSNDGSITWEDPIKSDISRAFSAGLLTLEESEEYVSRQITDLENGGAIVVVPQALTKSSQINITFKDDDEAESEYTKTLYIDNTASWNPGTCYTYTLEVSTNGTIVVNDNVYISSWDYLIESDIYGSYDKTDYAYINLDDYDEDSLVALKNKIAEYDTAGITRYIVKGEYFDGCFGDVTQVDQVRADVLADYGFDIYGPDIGMYILQYMDLVVEYLANMDIASPFGEGAANIKVLDLSQVTGLDTKIFPFMFNGGVDSSFSQKIFPLLNTVVLPDDVTAIPNFTFFWNLMLQEINLDYVETIGDCAFVMCSYLKNLNMYKVTSIGALAFLMCDSISVIDAPLVTYLGWGAILSSSTPTLSMLSLPSYEPSKTMLEPTFSYPENLVYVNLSKAGSFDDYGDTTLYGDFYDAYSNAHLVLNYDKRSTNVDESGNAQCFPLVDSSDATMWGGYQWGRISYVMDDGVTIDGVMNLDDYNDSVEALREAVLQRSALGITNFEISGAYFEGCFGTAATSTSTDVLYDVKSPFFDDGEGNPIKVTTFDISGVTGIPFFETSSATDYSARCLFSQQTTNGETYATYTTEFVLPDDVKVLPPYLFYYNIHLSSVNVLSVETIYNESQFSYCSNLVSINMPKIAAIPARTFSRCSKLSETYFPQLTTIGSSAFAYTVSLTSFDFSGLTEIPTGAFYYSALTSIYLPQVKTIRDEAFWGNNGYSVSLRAPVATTVEEEAFKDADISSISMPRVESLGDECFSSNLNLEILEIPSVKSLGSKVFDGCTNLYSLTLPSVTTLANDALDGLTALTELRLTTSEAITLDDPDSDLTINSTNYPVNNIDLYLHVNKSPDYVAAEQSTPLVVVASNTTYLEWCGLLWKTITFSDGDTPIDSAINLTECASVAEVKEKLTIRDNMGIEAVTITGIYFDGALGSAWGVDSPFADLVNIKSVNILNITNLDLPEGVWNGSTTGTPLGSITTLSINGYMEDVTLPAYALSACDLDVFESNCITYIGKMALYKVFTTLKLTAQSPITIEDNSAFADNNAYTTDLWVYEGSQVIVESSGSTLDYNLETRYWGTKTWKSITVVKYYDD